MKNPFLSVVWELKIEGKIDTHFLPGNHDNSVEIAKNVNALRKVHQQR